MKDKDQVMPENKWKFDNEVAGCFDNMLERSIPQYWVMRKLVFDIACKFQKDYTSFIDLGTSLGESLTPLVSKFEKKNYYLGLEVSDAMIKKARERIIICIWKIYGNNVCKLERTAGLER